MSKSAREMFEEEDFKQTKNGTYKLEYQYITPRGIYATILFRKNKRKVYYNGRKININTLNINGKLDKIIYQQCKELGWLDDQRRSN